MKLSSRLKELLGIKTITRLTLNKKLLNELIKIKNLGHVLDIGSIDSPYKNFINCSKYEILDIEISTICNKRCSFCYKSNTDKGENMTLDTYKETIRTSIRRASSLSRTSEARLLLQCKPPFTTGRTRRSSSIQSKQARHSPSTSRDELRSSSSTTTRSRSIS